MATIESLNQKIESLKKQLEESSKTYIDETSKLQTQLSIIDECINIINDEDLLLGYDFTKVIELVENYDYKIENLGKIISDIQSALLIRKELGLTKEIMPLEETQISSLNDFINKLQELKSNINEKLQNLVEPSKSNVKIETLESLKAILEGKGRRKFYTTDMFETFCDEFDVLNLQDEEASELLEGFFNTRNFTTRHVKEREDFNKVVSLYKEYIPAYMKSFNYLLKDYEDEITANIDLEITREILQFFKDNNLIDKFRKSTSALLKITLYGNPEYIKNDIYPMIMSKEPDKRELYFEDALATIWVNEKGSENYVRRPFRISRTRDKNKKTGSLYPSCHTINYKELNENIKILKENSDLFDESMAIDDDGANLKLKTLPPWILKKNIELCKLFGMGKVSKIPASCIEQGDIENKTHLAIELGLLNPPMTESFLEMDSQIVRNENFQTNMQNKGIYNQSIRNYFQRFLSLLPLKSINEYAYLTYKLQKDGYVKFYNKFFSDSKAGRRNPEFTKQIQKESEDDKKMSEFIDKKFIDWYPELIENYYEYESMISEYTGYGKNLGFNEGEYFDLSILNEELIKKLEENNIVNDIIIENGRKVERKNEYVYLFKDRIVSRYKVLHNASILKGLYGYLDENMLMTCIVRNSFFDKNSIESIQEEIQRGKTL